MKKESLSAHKQFNDRFGFTPLNRRAPRRSTDVGHVGFEGLFSLISLCPEFELFLQNGLKESPISVFISR